MRFCYEFMRVIFIDRFVTSTMTGVPTAISPYMSSERLTSLKTSVEHHFALKSLRKETPLPATQRRPLVLFLLGALLSGLMFHTLEIHDDNLQILRKVHKLLEHGEWSHFGNRGTAVGFVPGSLMTALTAGPMMLVQSPYAAMFVIFLFHALALAALLRVANQIKPAHLASVATPLLLVFWLNPWRVEQSELYNPAYLFLFSSLHLWSALQMREQKNLLFTCLHVCSIGFCFQFHFSAIILLIASGLLVLLKLVRIHWVGFVLGAGLVGLSLVPWAIAYWNQPELAVSVATSSKTFLGRNFLVVYPVLKAISYWFRYGSTYFGRHIFSEITFEWISWGGLQFILYWLFHTLKWGLALITIVISFRWQKEKLRHTFWGTRPLFRFQKNLSPLDWFYRYFFLLFAAMILAAGLSPVEFNHWHLILCFPAIALFMSMKLHFRMHRWAVPKQNKFVLILAVGFTLYNFLAAAGSRSHSLSNNYHELSRPHLECIDSCR